MVIRKNDRPRKATTFPDQDVGGAQPHLPIKIRIGFAGITSRLCRLFPINIAPELGDPTGTTANALINSWLKKEKRTYILRFLDNAPRSLTPYPPLIYALYHAPPRRPSETRSHPPDPARATAPPVQRSEAGGDHPRPRNRCASADLAAPGASNGWG